MNTKREANFDLLRIISAVAVIIIHVSANYKTEITNIYKGIATDTQIFETLYGGGNG